MTKYTQKEGDIVIYKVKEKKNERGPDFTGKALIDGKEKDVSLWFKSETMLAGSIKPKYEPDFKAVKSKIENTKTYNKPLDDDQEEAPF